MNVILHSRVQMGDMEVCTWLDADSGAAGQTLIPLGMDPLPFTAKQQIVDSMVQLKLVGDLYPCGFAGGITLHNAGTVDQLHFADQQVFYRADDRIELVTTLKDDRGYTLLHRVTWEGGSWLRCAVTFENHTDSTATLEKLDSFNLCGLSPYVSGDGAGTMLVHRLRTGWSSEGRLDTATLEQLHLEQAWLHVAVRCERFGQAGSLPCNRWAPWMMLEDTVNHVYWGMQIAHNASWQMELHRLTDGLSVGGGLGDADFAHWKKNVAPGESFTTPDAVLTVCRAACLDDAAPRLAAVSLPAVKAGPASEQDLPIMFNEYCTTWCDPTPARLLPVLEAVKGKGFDYFIIDAGWYKPDDPQVNWVQAVGDFVPNATMYPDGIGALTDAIRQAGMVPGLWFELDTVGCASQAFTQTEDLLTREGYPLQAGWRRFRAMARPDVRQKLHRRVTDLLKANHFGYIKIDFNDSMGVGCDGYESLGEGLRQTLAGSAQFIREMKEAIPELVVENCASGGHRLEPMMLGLTALASFSDAHECEEIPIIAANMHRYILPRQSQIWVVLRAEDSDRRLVYSMTNALLGRMCVSGDVEKLSPHQWALVDEASLFTKKACRISAMDTPAGTAPLSKATDTPTAGRRCCV